jgi:hypothetical protein
MDPQVEVTYGSTAWASQRYRDLFDRLLAQGDEIGLHTHVWRWDEAAGDWIADMGDQTWVEYCLDVGFKAFETSMNQPCRLFRFGDHWMNNTTVEFIEKKGVTIDLTTEPGQNDLRMTEAYTGNAPDYSQVPKFPYRPSRTNFTKRGKWRKRKLWMVPMSTCPSTVLLVNLDPPLMKESIDAWVDGVKRPYLALPMRTDAPLNPIYRANIIENLESILSRSDDRKFVFATPTEFVSRWL